MNVGDIVRVIGVPPGLNDNNELQTRSLFEKCVGKSFPIVAFDGPLVELHVGKAVGDEAFEHAIWVELEYLALVGSSELR